MRLLLTILIYITSSFSVFSQDSKKITNKYFSDFEIDIPTPAFQKKKGFTKYDQMMSFLDTLIMKYPNKISYDFIGSSQKGKKIPIVYIGDKTNYTSKVCFMGGLHGNEPASSEGMLFLIHNLLSEDSLCGFIDNLNIAIIPMANIDGYEKQSRYAANGQDLNRDHTKLTNPETNAIKSAISGFNPDVMVDFHEYKPYRVDFINFGEYGTTSMFDCMFLYSGNLNVCPSIRATVEDVFLSNAKKQLDYYDLKYHNYLSSKHKNNKVFFNLGSVSPRSSATSFALGNCISMLMEIRGVGLNRNSFKRRIFTTYLLANSFLESAHKKSQHVKNQLKKCSDFPEEIVIKYKKEKSNYQLSMIDVYNNDVIAVDILLYNGLKCNSELKRKRPKYYIVEKELSIVTDKLKVLGLEIDTLDYDELLEVESFKINFQEKSPKVFQGFYENIVKASLVTEEKVFEKGTFVIPMDQRKSNIAVETLEPEMLSGFLRFNVIQPSELNKIHRYVLNKEL
jgi:hypothetical protein